MAELSLTLPKARSFTRRRRAPRPPRFTRWQMIALAWDSSLIVYDVLSGFVGTPAGVLIVLALLFDVRMIVLDAVRGRRPGLWRMLPLALWLSGVLAWCAELVRS